MGQRARTTSFGGTTSHWLGGEAESGRLASGPVSSRVAALRVGLSEMSEEMHGAALLTLGYVFGRVRQTKEIVNLFGAAAAKAE